VRVVFLGNDPWSVPTLEALAAAADITVDLVITNPPRPAGRGSRLTPTAVAEAARELGLVVLEAEGVRAGAGRDAIVAGHPDALVVVAYGEILTPEVLGAARLGALNVHFSLLPRWRGAAPVQRAILEGDEDTGVSLMVLDEGLDTGPVVETRRMAIAPEDDAGSLGARLAGYGAEMVPDALRMWDAGSAVLVEQPTDGVTYAAKPSPEERRIDWGEPADRVVRRVRAFAPSPGATTTFRGTPLKVLRAASRGGAPGRPGSVTIDAGGTPVVATTDGAVAVLQVAPAGRTSMSGADWARGARIAPEDRFA
jgi:methionyl-tRNA formyltransferase